MRSVADGRPKGSRRRCVFGCLSDEELSRPPTKRSSPARLDSSGNAAWPPSPAEVRIPPWPLRCSVRGCRRTEALAAQHNPMTDSPCHRRDIRRCGRTVGLLLNAMMEHGYQVASLSVATRCGTTLRCLLDRPRADAVAGMCRRTLPHNQERDRFNGEIAAMRRNLAQVSGTCKSPEQNNKLQVRCGNRAQDR